MKKSRILAMLLTVSMLFALCACGGGQTGGDQPTPGSAQPADNQPSEAQPANDQSAPASVNNILDERTVKIGVMYFTWTSRIATALMDYCDYLSENMNVEFEYYTCGFDNDSCISTVENMITAGCDGGILLVSSGITEVVNICTEADFPVALITGKPTYAEEELLPGKPILTACIHPSTDSRVSGIQMAQAMLDLGYTKGAVISTIPGMIEAGDEETQAFIDTFKNGGGTLLAEVREMPGPTMITAADTVMTQYGDELDFMYGLLDVIQAAVTGSDKDIKIVSNELPSDGGVSMFRNAMAHMNQSRTLPETAALPTMDTWASTSLSVMARDGMTREAASIKQTGREQLQISPI